MIRQYGPELTTAGYAICALQHGQKYPNYKGWQNNPLSAEACATYKPENAGVGIICGIGDVAVYGLDFDIPGDFEFAEAMRKRALEILGDPDGAYRIGMPPKFLIPVQGKPGSQKQTTPWFTKDGNRCRFEFLGHGQQFVAENVHPDTGLPYEWYGEPMLPFESGHLPSSVTFLPEISNERLSALQNAFAELALAHGWAREKQEGCAVSGPLFDDDSDDDFIAATDAELTPHPPLGLSVEDAERYLSDFPGATDYDTWIKVGMALHHEFSGSREGLRLWDDWSSKVANYRGLGDLEYRWEGFGKETLTPITMAFIVKSYNERHYDESKELTDTGRAKRLFKFFNGHLFFTRDEGAWYKWGGTHWSKLSSVEAGALASYVSGDVLREDIRKAQAAHPDKKKYFSRKYEYFQQDKGMTAVVRAAQKLPEFHRSSTDFDADSRYFGVANGDIDLTTGEFLPPDPKRFVSQATPVVYDKDAKCPLWEKTVADVFAGRPEMPSFIQRVFGYAMMGNPVEEKIFIFHGNGSNGKSTILNTIRKVFGAYAVTMEDSTVTSMGRPNGGNAGGSRADILALKGKRLALVPETEAEASLREAMVKRLVSLDAITARGTYARSMTTFTPTAVPILSTNHVPEIRETDNGIWRRVVTISFNERFEGRKDTYRQDALKKELPGILNWVIAGALDYQKNGLQIPEEVIADTEGKRRDFDLIQAWLDECCDIDDSYRIRSTEALSSWQSWVKRNGYTSYRLTMNRLTRALYAKGFNKVRASIGGKLGYVYKGLRLVDEFEDLEA